MRAPDWLTARPVAHRGLHDRARGIIENMPGAVQAAIDGNFAIEVDIQLTADGEAMVHHDDELGRLTEGSGALRDMTAAELRAVRFKDTAERMMSLGDLCALVAGRVPLVIEVKSHFDGDRKLVARMARGARLPIAGRRSACRSTRTRCWRCASRCRSCRAASSPSAVTTTTTGRSAPPAQRDGMLHLRHAFRTRPHFVAYLGQRVAGPGAMDGAPSVRPALADLDRAHAGAARPRRALRRPDDFRRFPAGNLSCGAPLKSRLQCTILGGLVTMCDGRS